MAEVPETLFGGEQTLQPGGPQPGSPQRAPSIAGQEGVPEVLFRPQSQPEVQGFVENLSTSFSLDSPVAALKRRLETSGLPVDEDFMLTPDKQREMTQDVNPELRFELLDSLSDAVSQQHADLIKEQFMTEVENESTLAQAGMAGLATRLLANVIDPVNLALAFGTGGVGVATKASMLTNALRIGAWTAAEAAAIETAVVAGSHTRGADDVLFSAFAGFGMGGLAGAAFGRLNRTVETASNRQVDEIAREAIDNTGLDSVGAARVQGYSEPLMEREAAAMFDISDDAERVPYSAFGKARFDAVGRLGQSDDAFVRDLGRGLAEEATGVHNHGVVRFGASERAALTHRTLMTDFRRVSEPSYQDWLTESGHGWKDRYNLARRDDFFQQVTKATREGDHSSPAVRRAAEAHARSYARYLDEMQRSDVAGFQDLPRNPRYVPRMFNNAALREFGAKYGSAGLERLVKAGMKAMADDLDDTALNVIAKNYATKIRRLSSGMDAGISHGVRVDDVDFLKSLLRETELDEGAIDAVTNTVRRSVEKSSKIARAKGRLDIDENISIRLFNKETGEKDLVSFTDILENNAEKILFGYSRTMSGWAGLARQVNIKSPADIQRVLNTVRSRGEEAGRPLEDVEQDIKRLQYLFDGITGVPLETDPASTFAKGARAFRDINFMRIGAAFGFAQLAEVGALLGTVGIRTMVSMIPEFRGMIRRGIDGKLEGELARDLEDMLAPGVDRLLNQASTRWEEHGFALADSKKSFLRSVDNGVQIAKRATADIGGLNAATTVFQRAAAAGISQKLAGFAFGAKLSRGQMRRLRGMGISEEMQGRINAQIKKHSTTTSGLVPGGRKLISINPNRWDDTDALDTFTLAVHRESRRVVQENDIGASTPWLHSSLGKLLTQFRTFALTAWSKATLHNIHHRDIQSANLLLYSMFMGGSAYVVQQSLSEGDKEKRAEKLSLENIGLSAFQRVGMASITPALIDTAATNLFRTDPLFAYGRSSGLASGFLQGNPTVDLIDKLSVVAGLPAVAARGDVEMSKRDYRSLTGMLPVLGGLVGVRRVLDSMAGDIAE